VDLALFSGEQQRKRRERKVYRAIKKKKTREEKRERERERERGGNEKVKSIGTICFYEEWNGTEAEKRVA